MQHLLSNTGKRIILLDASSLKLLACPLKFYHQVWLGYRAGLPSIDMVYGTAFHAFVKEMVDNGGNYGPAIKLAIDIFEKTPYTTKERKGWMNTLHLQKTCIDYWEYYYGDGKTKEWETLTSPTDGKRLTELKFATLPYYEDDHIIIQLAGTIDDICRRSGGGAYAIRDYKTSSAWDTDSYLAGYRTSSQLKFYVFVTYWYAQQYPYSIFAEIVKQGRIGAFIDGIFLKSGATDSQKTTFKRSEVFFFSEQEMLTFKLGLDTEVIPKIVAMSQKEPYPFGLLTDSCKLLFGSCEYLSVCAAPNKDVGQSILANHFVQKTYNPLQFS